MLKLHFMSLHLFVLVCIQISEQKPKTELVDSPANRGFDNQTFVTVIVSFDKPLDVINYEEINDDWNKTQLEK